MTKVHECSQQRCGLKDKENMYFLNSSGCGKAVSKDSLGGIHKYVTQVAA
ncbi:hypothetical protein GKR59_03225 [Providencia alcalifaciens]|nr:MULTISPECIES: hypothetical protein [Providencia]MTC48660.1 hypothetical protein [Providencia alcalifaciens]